MRDKRSVQYLGTTNPNKPSKGNPNVNGGDLSDSDETVPGPGAIAGMSPFAKQAKQCRGPVVSRSKECIELRKKMNRSQENKVTKMINKLKRNQGIQEAAEGKPGGEKVGVAGTGTSKWGGDIAGTQDGSAQGRLAGPYNNPGKDNAVDSNGLVHTNTAGPTLTSITREMEALGIDTTSPFAVWKYANARDSDSRLNSSLLALRNPITDPDTMQQWRNGDNSAVVPQDDRFDVYGGYKYLDDDDDNPYEPKPQPEPDNPWPPQDNPYEPKPQPKPADPMRMYESPNRMSWWKNNWKERTLNEEGEAPVAPPVNSKGTGWVAGQVGEPGPIAGLSDPAMFSNPRVKRKKSLVDRLQQRRVAPSNRVAGY